MVINFSNRSRMRVTLVATSFAETTLPLYKYLYFHSRIEVSLFYMTSSSFLEQPCLNMNGYHTGVSRKLSTEEVMQLLGAYLNSESVNGVNLFIRSGIIQSIFPGKEAISLINKGKPDVVIFIGNSPTFIPILRSLDKNVKKISMLHEVSAARVVHSLRTALKYVLESTSLKYIINDVTALICFSDNERRKLERIVGRNRSISTIKFGRFEKNIFDYKSKNIRANNRTNYILLIGYLKPYKGLEFFFDILCHNQAMLSMIL